MGSRRHLRKICLGLILLFPTATMGQTFSSFSELRNSILNIIGSAKKNVYVASYFLTDGEIVTALYLAKYRKLDVQVFLDFEKANHYMSRLSYLKRQKIPAFLAPKGLPLKKNTIIQVDDEIYISNSPLDYRTLKQQFTLTQQKAPTRMRLLNSFASGLQSPTPAKSAPRIRVGRSNSYLLPSPKRQRRQESNSDIYDYNRYSQPRKAPEGVTTKLPPKTKHQLKQIKEVEEAMSKRP